MFSIEMMYQCTIHIDGPVFCVFRQSPTPVLDCRPAPKRYGLELFSFSSGPPKDFGLFVRKRRRRLESGGPAATTFGPLIIETLAVDDAIITVYGTRVHLYKRVSLNEISPPELHIYVCYVYEHNFATFLSSADLGKKHILRWPYLLYNKSRRRSRRKRINSNRYRVCIS